ncbi:hypothetical protein BE17_03805 [Sorangium cellulosum]|uniref:Uncharacterized protein n=1 Tax=Sorangium cellulosum TaxID=56 RepID=A0A150RTW5_SORCE|nr:hypothetical protein BE17_03805 [Sorangium cellulosum]
MSAGGFGRALLGARWSRKAPPWPLCAGQKLDEGPWIAGGGAHAELMNELLGGRASGPWFGCVSSAGAVGVTT